MNLRQRRAHLAIWSLLLMVFVAALAAYLLLLQRRIDVIGGA